MVTNGRVRVIRFFNIALVGPQLNWSTREKECYGIYFCVKTFEDLFGNRRFILKTDHMNLTYLNVTLTGKVQDKDFYLCQVHKRHQAFLATLEPKHRIPDAIFWQIAAVHNSMVGHWGLEKCQERLNDLTIIDRTITQFILQCPCCQDASIHMRILQSF